MSTIDFTSKYRPKTLDEVRGQASVVKSLKEIIEQTKALPNAIIFSGPSGVGKTTLARAAAMAVGCPDDEQHIKEENAAKRTGVDDMREVIDSLAFFPMGTRKRVVILDEAHRLSKQAWDSLLKSIEEPPQETSWILCSTEFEKIPKTIQTRCHHYELSKVKPSEIVALLNHVLAEEKIELEKPIVMLIAMRADGSPRQALQYLSMCRNCKSKEEAESLIKAGLDENNSTVIKLAQALLNNSSWDDVCSIIKGLEEEAETVRLIIVAYMNKVVLGTKNQETLERGLKILMHFLEKPCYNAGEKLAPITLMSANCVWG